MASKIRVLSDHTINKIAAGEVIENPASVVKELVENSLDAGSTDIAIEIQGGGRQMIRISDNGCGMGPDDALLCLERHATSKLREVEDIHTLSTMGFRGEAIPSIASISKFNLLTCSAQESTGTMVIVDGGKIVSCHPAARSQGTTIEVKSLFFNVPVRKKFLKSPTIDANEILKTISLIALGHPSIKFQLISDGKHLLTAPASKDYAFDKQLTVRIEDVLGRDFNENITYIEKQSEGVSLRGMIGRPGYTRHNRSAQYLFINKRAIVSPFIAYAVKEGFGTSIPAGRFPVYLLHLEMAGELVDVNVHPQKREVRLRQEQLIKELVVTAVRSGISYVSDPFLSDLPNNYVSPIFSKILQEPESVDFKDIPETWVFKAKPEAPYSLPKPEISHFDEPATHREPPKRILPPQALQLSLSKEQPLKVLATIPGYIILDGLTTHSFIEKGCKHNGGFVLIDQKSAHARILFEKLLQGQSTGPIPQQTLLIPYTLELASHETEKLQRVIPALNKMGIQIREFGVNTYLIDAIPQMFGENQVDLFVKDLVHNLCTMSSEQTDEEAVSHNQAKHIAQAATRTSISLQTHLSLIEAQSLIDRLLSCQQPYQCPSGRPTLVQISSDDLAKLFHR